MSLVNRSNLPPIAQEAIIHRVLPQELPGVKFNLTATRTKISELANKKLIDIPLVSSKKQLPTKLNQDYSFEVHRLQALISRIADAGIVTSKDKDTLKDIEVHFENINKRLPGLTHAQRKQAQTTIRETKKFVKESHEFIQAWEQYLPVTEALDQSLLDFTDALYDPEKGNVLNGASTLKKVVDQLKNLHQQVHKTQKQTMAAAVIQPSYNNEIEHLDSIIEQWSDDVRETLQKEFNELNGMLKQPAKAQEALVQIKALYSHLEDMLRQLSPILKTQPIPEEWSDFFKHLEAIEADIESFQLEFKKQLVGTDLSKIKSITYGSEDWDDWVAVRPQGWLNTLWNRAIDTLNPLNYLSERWRPDQTQLKNFALLALAVGEQVHKISNLPSQGEKLRQYADQMQKEVLMTVPKEKAIQIDKEAGLIGTALSDVYKDLTPKKIAAMARRYPETGAALQQAKETFGDKVPSKEQVLRFTDTYRLQRLLNESPKASPYKRISFAEWWSAFRKHEASSIEEGPPPVTSAAATTSGIIPSIFRSISSFFSSKPEPVVPVEIPKNCYDELHAAAVKLPGVQIQITSTPALRELQEEAVLLRRKLVEAMAGTAMAKTCLPKLASWTQQVDDVCYAISDLEGRVAKAMEKARQDLEQPVVSAQNDAELMRFGSKHKNIIKQARLVNALQIPDVIVPVPLGFSTDQVQAFLQKEAPEVFVHWKALGALTKSAMSMIKSHFCRSPKRPIYKKKSLLQSKKRLPMRHPSQKPLYCLLKK